MRVMPRRGRRMDCFAPRRLAGRRPRHNRRASRQPQRSGGDHKPNSRQPTLRSTRHAQHSQSPPADIIPHNRLARARAPASVRSVLNFGWQCRDMPLALTAFIPSCPTSLKSFLATFLQKAHPLPRRSREGAFLARYCRRACLCCCRRALPAALSHRRPLATALSRQALPRSPPTPPSPSATPAPA